MGADPRRKERQREENKSKTRRQRKRKTRATKGNNGEIESCRESEKENTGMTQKKSG